MTMPVFSTTNTSRPTRPSKDASLEDWERFKGEMTDYLARAHKPSMDRTLLEIENEEPPD